MGKAYTHLNAEEREQIAIGLAQGWPGVRTGWKCWGRGMRFGVTSCDNCGAAARPNKQLADSKHTIPHDRSSG